MANNNDETVDFTTNYINQDCFTYCYILNATDETPPTELNRDHDHTFEKCTPFSNDSDLTNSTRHTIQSKKVQFIMHSATTPSKSREKISVCTSTTSIGDNAIKLAKSVDRLKRETLDAITSTTRLSMIVDVACCETLPESLPYVTDHCTYHVPVRCAQSTARYAVSSDCISIVDDAFARAYERRRRVDSIFKEIARVQDTLTDKMRFAPAIEKASLNHAQVSATSTAYQTQEKIFEKPLVSSVVHTENKSPVITTAETAKLAVMQLSSIHFALESPDVTDEPRVNAQTVPLTKETPKDESARTDLHPKTQNFQNTAATVTDVTQIADDREDEIETEVTLSNKITLQLTLDKDVLAIDTTVDAAVGSLIIDSVREPTVDIESLKSDQSRNGQTVLPSDYSEVAPVIDQIIDSVTRVPSAKVPVIKRVIKPAQIAEAPQVTKIPRIVKTPKVERLASTVKVPQIVKTSERLLKPRIAKVPKVVKSRQDEKAEGVEKIPQPTKTQIARKINKVSTCSSLLSAPSEVSKKSFNCRIPRKEECWDDRIEIICPPRIVGSTRCREHVASCNVRLKKPKCDTSIGSCSTLSDKATRNTVLNPVCYPPLVQDSCVTRCRADFCSPVDDNAFSRSCNINDCAKRLRATFGNPLRSNLYRDSGAKYYCPHLNGIGTDNVRTGHCCHRDDSRSTWNDGCYGRSRSYYWTGENLYFISHPWTWWHLPRHN